MRTGCAQRLAVVDPAASTANGEAPKARIGVSTSSLHLLGIKRAVEGIMQLELMPDARRQRKLNLRNTQHILLFNTITHGGYLLLCEGHLGNHS